MDTELKCNRLTCRKTITDKAVVTTCSHIFCVDCANELFNDSRLCPACETSLTEPDDVVVSTLSPSNDYKTSVLSGLSPALILDICSRAISFWQYQTHQEYAFQQAVFRNVNAKTTELQKQLDSVVREANAEINILTNKLGELERDLEVERRRVRELQDASRDRDKEYQKLRHQYDKVKQKALLGAVPGSQNTATTITTEHKAARRKSKSPGFIGAAYAGLPVDVEAVGGGLDVQGIHRTPLINRSTALVNHQPWAPVAIKPQRQPFNIERSARDSVHASRDSRQSADEVENLLTGRDGMTRQYAPMHTAGDSRKLRVNQGHAVPGSVARRGPGNFKPVGVPV